MTAWLTSGGIQAVTCAPRLFSTSAASRTARGGSRRERAIFGVIGDAETRHIDGGGITERHGRLAGGVATAVDDFGTERHIGNCARQHSHLADDGALANGNAEAPSIRGAPGGRFETGDATERGGDAQAAADVGSQAKRGASRRDDGRLTATAAAGGAFKIPGIVSAAIDGIVALEVEQNLGHVGLAQYDRACFADTRDMEVVLRGPVICPRWQAKGRGSACQVQTLFNGDGNAVQGRKIVPSSAARIGIFCLGAGRVLPFDNNGIQ